MDQAVKTIITATQTFAAFSKFQINILSNDFVYVLVRLGWQYDERWEIKLTRKDDTGDKTELAVNTPKSTFSRF